MWSRRTEEGPAKRPEEHPVAPASPLPPEPQRAVPHFPERPPNLGESVRVKGEVSGEEDLLIEGTVEGKITLNEHALWIGKKGRVQGEVQARTITILGQVTGPLTATERVEIRASATVVGDIVTQRIVIEEGARFKGSVDSGMLGNNGFAEGIAEAAAVGGWGAAVSSRGAPDDLR